MVSDRMLLRRVVNSGHHSLGVFALWEGTAAERAHHVLHVALEQRNEALGQAAQHAAERLRDRLRGHARAPAQHVRQHGHRQQLVLLRHQVHLPPPSSGPALISG